MSSYKPIDSKREEFRKYLERTGVMEALTKALVALYEETDKPEDALGYIRGFLGDSGGGTGGSSSNGGGGDESSKTLLKQMEDLKMKSENTEPAMKGGGDQGNLPQKLEEAAKAIGENHPVGAEGDAPIMITKEGGDIGVTDAEVSGKQRVAESVPPESVA